MSDQPDANEHARIRAAESRIEYALAGLFSIAVAGAFLYVRALFRPIAPAWNLAVWSWFQAVVVAIMLATPAIVLIRRPDDAEIARIWARVGKVVAVLFDLAAAASVWLLLPYASESLRLLMVVFYAACIVGQVIATAESVDNITFGVVSIFGSAAWFFARDHGPYSTGLSVFLLLFGGLAVVAAFTLKTAIRSAIVARLKAEEASGQLAAALDRVTDERDAKSRFLATASHDLRQPLQAAALFFHQVATSPDHVRRERAVEGVRLAFAEADSLLERILDHLRLDAGAVEARVTAIPAGPVLHRIAAESAAIAQAAEVEIRVVDSSLWMLGDADMTARALRNFLRNALRHAQAKKVLVGARRSGDLVRLWVIDDGVGVPEDERAGLFREFTQGARAARDPRGGLGLGLASARRIARLMQGEIGLDAAWGGGAAFWLDLPRTTGLAVTATAAAPALAASVGRVLIVEDDAAAQEALGGLFAGQGWQVVVAAGVAGAQALAREFRPQLVISDWRLPDGKTGLEAIAAARGALPELAALPALLITGDGTAATHRAIAASGLPVLFKPTRPESMLALAAQLISSAGD